MAYTLKTFADIYNAVREELKIQSTDTTSINRIKRDINIVYEELIAEHKWWWLNGQVDLQVEPYISAGTASVTQNSNVVTLSIAPGNSRAKYKFSVDGFDEIYTIDAHTTASTTLVLDGVFTGATNPSVTYKIWTDKIALPSDLKETSEVTHDYTNQPLESVGLQEFRRCARAQPKLEAKPRYYYTGDFIDPVEATNASIPSLSTRSSSGITKTLIFTTTVPNAIVVGARLHITKPGDPSYAGDVTVATVSTTTTTNDTITFTGRSALDESATADTSLTVKLVGSESNNTRYREMSLHPVLSTSRTTLHIDYLKEVLTLDNDSDEPAMPIADRSVLLYGALERAWTRERNPEAAAQNGAKHQNKLAKMAGKLQDSFDAPRLMPSRRYLAAKRSSARGTLSNGSAYQFMEGAGSGGGVPNVTGKPNSIAAYDTQGNLSNTTATTTNTELGYLSGVTSSVQAQLNNKQPTGSYLVTLTGDVTTTGSAATIAANAVTNAKAAQMSAHTFKGNNTGSTANALDLTATQLTAELNNVVGDSGSGGTKGLVPAPTSGDAAAGKFLKANGAWVVPPLNAGTVTSVTFTGDGTVLSSTPSSAVTASGTVTAALNTQTKNTVLAGPTTGSNAAPTFRALVSADLPATVNSAMKYEGGNGFGSTNTVIRRFSTLVYSNGSDITYTGSATLGDSFTINTTGIYSVTVGDSSSVASGIGMSVNSNQLTTDIASITNTSRLGLCVTTGSNVVPTVSVVFRFTAGDVIRHHGGGGANGSDVKTYITITRIA